MPAPQMPSPPAPRPSPSRDSSRDASRETPPRVAPPPSKGGGLAARLAELQVNRPALPLLVTGLLTVVAIFLATRLSVLTGFESLLPASRPSVQELDRVAAKTAGVSTLFVVLQGGEGTPTAALQRAADALVPEIERLGPPWVGSVEDGVHEAFRYLSPRAGLYVERDRLTKLRDDIEARYAYEVNKATGALLDDDEPPPEVSARSIEQSLGLNGIDAGRYPDGYYQSKDGKTVVVAIRSKVIASDFAAGSEAIRRVREVVERVRPASFDPGITYGLAGDLQTGIAEYAAINEDLTDVGVAGAALIAAVVFLYYLRVRTLLAMLITIGVGVAWTFGVTQLAIGHLNMATGFLFSIVAGNGINFGIIYMARYLEARRGGASLLEGVRVAHRETWLPTLTAGCAASAAYGSLVVTEFRGFRDFGLIGGVGMVLCWVATFVALPSILAVTERLVPLEQGSPGLLGRLRQRTQGGLAFGGPFARLAARGPVAITLTGLALAAVGVVATVAYVRADPMEYDLRNLRNDESARAEQIRLGELAEEITGYVGTDGMAILVDRPEQVEPLRAALYAKRDAAPEGEKPFKEIYALQDLIPKDQEAKIPLLQEIKDRVVRAQKRGLIGDDDWARIQAVIPPDDLAPFGIDDLPAGVARAFTETDGTRGRIVYISPISAESVHDAHYLFRWADAYRETRLPDDSVVRGSGRAVIYADMWAAVIDDVPPAVLFSLAATVLVVLVAFRGGRPAFAVLGALLVGASWMAGLLVLMDVKLNFLNFIALPLTFGIGVDYAVNIVQRYAREGAGGALTAVRETGGAVILCSLTTALGYLALIRSQNHAVRSLGVAAVIGELACLFAAVLVLPAALVWLDRRRPKGAESFLAVGRPTT
ncbi:efflux RND transporter permease subunit [Sorangium cellulosum]|uniref:efflux RND transporter permease subunit n=1 Tax=Sorangium cellulosum TaxID=56 RepID=UPI0009D70B1F|nr:MMPL family transporter [Sorangium cellulosum]